MFQDLADMKKLLPIIFSFVLLFTTLSTLLSPVAAFAQTTPTNSRWVIDPEVTFIGKNAARSGDFLNWTLQNYNWVCVKQIGNGACDNSNNPIAKYWSLIVLYIVVPMLFIVILITSAVIIITRGKSLTIMRFIPRFIAVVLLIIFSYSLLQFFYQFTDLIQGFFLRSNINNACPPNCISDKDLLYVGWDYSKFVGLRLLGDQYAESAFISLLLTKLTALTYFVMVFLLLVRKIILWFFIIVSPIFPILLLYYPVRNTGKIWIGEFFRWLLYAPLFAIFLNGLVYLWRNQIPLVFSNPNIGNANAIEYPTAVNILLGGPRQVVSPTNSVNLVETFALYVVSLIMLWVVILLPWILLQIFLDYAQNFAPGDTAVMKTLVNMATSKGGGGTGPQPPTEGGTAISLPFAKKFSVPIDIKPGPAGAAKEINAQGSTIKATFSQPLTVPSATVNAQVLNAANVKLPSMRDIARFDTALTSRDVTKQQEVSRFSEQLVRIANPVVIANAAQRDQMSQTRGKLVQQSKSGNVTANSLMNAANASTNTLSNMSNQKVKNMLAQMANPGASSTSTSSASSATSSTSSSNRESKEKLSQLNQMLQKESKQSNNQLAASILSVNEKTSDKEIQKIKDQLVQSSSSKVSKAVTSAISQSANSSSQVQNMIKQVANPSSVTKSSDKERVTQLRGTLEKASQGGNQLAASILSVNEKTTSTELESLQQRIQDAKAKGDSLATQVADTAKVTSSTTLPMVNRVQTVHKEDYQAVKDMWKQNYHNLEVPQGMSGTRSDWIKDDISSIDETIGLLSSTDQDKVQQGMDQVSNLLPFLLVGGFSQSEIVEYLKAKQDAAKEVSNQLTVEEDEKVGVATRSAHATQTMAAAMIEEIPASTPSASSSSDEEEESSLSGIGNVTNNTTNYTQPQISNEILNMVNVKIPKLRDIAQYETRALRKDTTRTAEVENMRTVLGNIADPSKITNSTDREKFEKVRESLLTEREKGNKTADLLLNAATRSEAKSSDRAKAVLSQIANPSLATAEADKKRFTQLHESLEKASKEGNQVASAILATKQSATPDEIDKLKEKIQDAKEKGDLVSASVLPTIATELPDANTLQPAEKQDYDEVEKMWEENYRTLPVPSEYGSDRSAWIKADTKYVDETIGLLRATDTQKQQEGQKRVSDIMPMLLLGGFTSEEISGYLKAKLAAGTTVLAELQKEEESKVSVSATTGAKSQENALEAEESSTDSSQEKDGDSKS
jgi:hypothetical protein